MCTANPGSNIFETSAVEQLYPLGHRRYSHHAGALLLSELHLREALSPCHTMNRQVTTWGSEQAQQSLFRSPDAQTSGQKACSSETPACCCQTVTYRRTDERTDGRTDTTRGLRPGDRVEPKGSSRQDQGSTKETVFLAGPPVRGPNAPQSAMSVRLSQVQQ